MKYYSLFILTIIQIILSIVCIFLLSYNIIDNNFITAIKDLTINQEAALALNLWFGVLTLAIWFINSFCLLKFGNKNDRKMFFYSLFNIFSLLLLFYYAYNIFNARKLKQQLDIKKNDLIDLNLFWDVILRKKHANKIFYNTLLSILMLLALSIEMLFIILAYFIENIKDPFIFSVLHFFTEKTNTACFLYLIYYLFFNKTKIFEINKWGVSLAVYITIVGLIYWAGVVVDGGKNLFQLKQLELISTFFSHLVIPVLFPSYVFFIVITNRLKTNKFKQQAFYNLIYPSFYTIYAFSLPFLIKGDKSVYGIYTNINTNNPIDPGSYISITFLLIYPILFSSFLWLYLYIIRKTQKRIVSIIRI